MKISEEFKGRDCLLCEGEVFSFPIENSDKGVCARCLTRHNSGGTTKYVLVVTERNGRDVIRAEYRKEEA